MSNLWIARDSNGDLWLFGRKPLRKKYVFMSEGWADKIANCLYPEVTWTNSPKELTINQK